MEPSSNSPAPRRRRKAAAWLDRTALAGLAAGIGLYLAPVEGTLRWGFWITLFFTVFHIFTSHLNPAGDE